MFLLHNIFRWQLELTEAIGLFIGFSLLGAFFANVSLG